MTIISLFSLIFISSQRAGGHFLSLIKVSNMVASKTVLCSKNANSFEYKSFKGSEFCLNSIMQSRKNYSSLYQITRLHLRIIVEETLIGRTANKTEEQNKRCKT